MNKIKAKLFGKKTLAFKNGVAGYLFILPFILGFLLFMLMPLFQSIFMSLSTVEISTTEAGFKMTYAGLTNYRYAVAENPYFNIDLVFEIRRMLISLPATLIFSFFIALLLNQQFKGRGFVRAIFFLPVILSSGVIVGLETNNALLDSMKEAVAMNNNGTSVTGVLQDILVTSNSVGSSLFDYVFGIVDQVYDIAIASGIQIIIFLSGLQTISVSMYEAAKIEGCTGWESFWKITLPMVSSLILVNFIYTVIDFFLKSDNQAMWYITDQVNQIQYGRASAMAWIYFGCVIVIIAIVSLIISKRVYYYE